MTKNTEKKTNFDLISESEICNEVMLQHPTLYDDLIWDEYNIKEKLEKSMFHYAQFRMIWLEEKHKLRKVELLRDEYTGKLYDNLKYKGEKTLNKSEIEKYYLFLDVRLQKFNRLYMKQEMRVEVYQYIAESFRAQGYAMANYIKAMGI